MYSDPNKYIVNTEFASSGNDNSVQLVLNVPSHSILSGQDSLYSTTVAAPSKWLGKQMRADMQVTGGLRVPGTYGMALINATSPTFVAYALLDVTRVTSGDIQLRCRIPNNRFPAATVTMPAFTVTARVRTVIGN